MWKGYFLALYFSVKYGRGCDLVFSVKETAGVFTTNLSLRESLFQIPWKELHFTIGMNSTKETLFYHQNEHCLDHCIFATYMYMYTGNSDWLKQFCFSPIGISLRMTSTGLQTSQNAFNFNCLWDWRLSIVFRKGHHLEMTCRCQSRQSSPDSLGHLDTSDGHMNIVHEVQSLWPLTIMESFVRYYCKYPVLVIAHACDMKISTWQDIIGAKLSISSTSTKFLRPLGVKKKVVPSSSSIALENSGSSSSSPRWAIWYK